MASKIFTNALLSALLGTALAASAAQAQVVRPLTLTEVMEFLRSRKINVDQGRMGPEWTFTNERMIAIGRVLTATDSTSEQKLQADAEMTALRNELLNKWLGAIKNRCASCVIELKVSADPQNSNSAVVRFGKDQWIEIGKDPWVFESTGSPFTLKDMITNSNEMNTVLWGAAEEAGLRPHYRVGGGHRHFEDSTFFKNDLKLYKDFFVFLANHPEMFMGPLGFDFTNSPPLALLSDEQKNEFERVLAETEGGKIRTIAEFKTAIKERVYTRAFYYTSNQDLEPWKYHAVNSAHKYTTEIRGLRPQQSLAHDIAQSALFYGIRDYLEKQSTPVKYERRDYSKAVAVTMDRGMQTYHLKVSPDFIQMRFEQMLRKVGMYSPIYESLRGQDFEKLLRRQNRGASCEVVF